MWWIRSKGFRYMKYTCCEYWTLYENNCLHTYHQLMGKLTWTQICRQTCTWTAANVFHKFSSKACDYCSWDFMTSDKFQIGLRLEPLYWVNLPLWWTLLSPSFAQTNTYDTVEHAEWIKPVSEWLGSALLLLHFSLLAIHKTKWGMFDHRVCVCHFNLWTSWFLWKFVWALWHFSIFQHHVFSGSYSLE